MDINQLRIFLAVANAKGFSKAASQLYVSQPMVTKTIKQLEGELNMKLIERSSKSFTLTDAGLRLKSLSEDLLQNFDNILKEISDMRTSNSGSITLAGPPLSLAVYFPKLLQLIRAKYPGINISLIECGSKTTVEMINDGKADIGVSQMPIENPDMDIFPIVRDKCVLLVNEIHPLATRDKVSISELSNEKFISLAKGFAMHDTVNDICRRAGFTPNIVYHTSLISFAEKLVSLNEGISILPRPLVGLYMPGGVKIIEIDEYIPWDVALILSNKGYRSNATQLTLELALGHFTGPGSNHYNALYGSKPLF